MEGASMKSKILATIVPPITGLVDESYPLVVALAHERPWPWFYSNYIQMVFKNDDQMGYNVRFYKTDHRGIMWDTLNPWINYNIINVNFLKSLNMGIIDLIVRSIDNGYYMTVYLDRFYIPGIRNYQKSHMTHEAMVFGYDLENEKIHIIEYTEAYMTQFVITFEEFRQAYEHCDQRRYEDVHLLKFDGQRHYEFDLINVSEQMKDYLSSRNTSERYRINSNPVYSPFVIFGMDVYKELRFLLDYNQLKFDIRVFNSIWEHKKIMKERVKYIADHGLVENFMEFFESCKEIEDKSYLLKSQFMRLCATQNLATLSKIYALLDFMEEKERSVYGRMVEKIDEQVEKNKIRDAKVWYPECSFRSGTRAIRPVSGARVAIYFDLVPLNDVMDGVIGYGDMNTQVIAYSSLFLILKFNPLGFFEAMDGDAFKASTRISYARNGEYHVKIDADFTDKVYDIDILDGEAVYRVADKFHFNVLVQNPADIDKVSLIHDNMSSFKVLNHRIVGG